MLQLVVIAVVFDPETVRVMLYERVLVMVVYVFGYVIHNGALELVFGVGAAVMGQSAIVFKQPACKTMRVTSMAGLQVSPKQA